MDIISGKFDNQITLYSPTTTQSSSSGATSYSYTAGSTIWCYVNNRANTEQFVEGKKNVDDSIDKLDTIITNIQNYNEQGRKYLYTENKI
jgi:head-tail adaptor